MGKTYYVNLKEEIKVSDKVKADIYRSWDSNTLTLVGILLGIWLAVFFGITSFLGIILGIIVATVFLTFCLILLKWKKSRDFLINFMRWLLE